MQRTLKTPIEIVGKGLHSGKRAALRVSPALADFGVWIQRVDVADRDNMIPARYDHVNDTRLCTRLANDAGVEVSTVEHLMAALAGTGIHNAMIEIDGPEIPIMDGSSAPFVAAILKAGLKELDAPLKAIRILKPVSINVDGFSASLSPSEKIEIEFAIDFDEAAIGKQSKTLQMSNGAFVRELSNCRTFCLRRDVDMMQSAGLALGGGLENAIVVDGDTVLNPEGFRREDECVRHKMLDALGDLALAGHPIIGRYHGEKAGHRATNLLLRELFARPDAWEMVECTPSQWHDLPGAHIKPTDFVLA
ncbi:UDP-3-O-acyl-N-acetylglucosamine deacetylase [Neptunicoccus sediminis]|uniref:UDP-3-O-acyl-N-acetylglucosamine deacetylase n=1 Tax=Neptunicoccus sediminis TaxID=1892596 RepID=UPI000845C7CF